jgi:hypothetical protein
VVYIESMKTSIWLPDDLVEPWRDSGDSLADLVRRGLTAGKPEPLDEKIRRIVREEVGHLPGDDAVRRIVRDAIRDAAMGG